VFADTQNVKSSDLDTLEELVNEKIKAATPVIVKVYEEGDPELKKVSYKTDNARHAGLQIKYVTYCLFMIYLLILVVTRTIQHP
jgi:hypothetical protein